MGAELETVKQLVEQNPVPEGVVKSVDLAWAVYRHGQIPDNYLICEKVFWEKVCKILGYIPAHINCSCQGKTYVSFSPNEISRRKR